MPTAVSTAMSLDYDRYLSREASGRVRSQLKEIKPYSLIPGMISFGVGIPHPSTWPVTGMTLSIPFAATSVFVPGYGCREPSDMAPLAEYTHPSKNDSLVPDLAEALQYSATYGTKHFNTWWKEHIERIHNPPYAHWEVLCTAANTDGMDAVMRTFFDRGDYMLVEEFAYPGLLSPATSLGFKPIGVPMDADGIDPVALDRIMEDWNEGSRPKMLIVVPTCSNPSGVTIPAYRKHEIYSICRKWDLLICEDDPYYFLQTRTGDSLVPSFLSMDIDGRVIRVDSFSKIIAPGSRLGFITGHKYLVEKIMNSRESATQCPSGISIATVTAILRAWGSHEGFEKHYVPHISTLYATRANLMLNLLKKHVPEQCLELPDPSGGMFLWVRLCVENHPDFISGAKSPEDLSKQVFLALVDEKVLCVPSIYFKAPSLSGDISRTTSGVYMRLSFSLSPGDEMEEGTIRMGRGLSREFGI